MAAAAALDLLLYLFWISLLFLSGSMQLCIEEERKALLNVRSGFPDVDRGISPWKGDECCNWEGVGCNNITGHVIELDLSVPYTFTAFNESKVHPSLFHLKHLEYLDISQNNLSGHQIPSSIGSLTRLQHLDLSYCGFGGEIPYQIGNLSHLSHLFLSDNQIYGQIPASLVHLRNLQFLDLSYNSYGGPFPSHFERLKKLRYLDLSGNQFIGSFPASLGKLSALEDLDLSSNYLVGDITEAHFANLTNLWSIDISYNNLSVKVSKHWLPPFQANDIFMRSCNLGPRFPPWLRNQTILHVLDISFLNVSHNHMRGMLPSSLECFKDLWSFDLSYNNFEGFLPRLHSLPEHLDLSHNSFSGPIPKSFLGSFFILSNNKLNGNIPSSICTNINLEIMNLANNDISGTLPDCWGNTSWLAIIDVSNNKLSGSIPKTFGFLARLQSLHMSNNNLSGTIPSTLQYCNRLTLIDLSWNKLSGVIPSWFGRRQSALRVLSLRSNNFTGAIPSELSVNPSLQVLDLARNNLFGSLPSSFGMFSSMMTSQNKKDSAPLYDGSSYYSESVILIAKDSTLPFTTSLSLVTSIDLSNNNLSGYIPKEITNLHGLYFLNMSSNHFSGLIPYNIGLMSQLESLDLPNNNLSGKIPSSISGLNFLIKLNLSYNNLIGKIPTGSQLQTFANLSYIGNSELCGEPLQIKCLEDNPTINDRVIEEEDMHEDNEFGRIWYFIGFAPGFVLGFWGFMGAVMIEKSIRIKYILLIDRIIGWFAHLSLK